MHGKEGLKGRRMGLGGLELASRLSDAQLDTELAAARVLRGFLARNDEQLARREEALVHEHAERWASDRKVGERRTSEGGPQTPLSSSNRSKKSRRRSECGESRTRGQSC